MEIGPIWRAMMRNKTGAILIALQIAVTMAIMVNAISIMQERSRMMARPSGIDEHNIFYIASIGFAEDFNERVTIEEDLQHCVRCPALSMPYSPIQYHCQAAAGPWVCKPNPVQESMDQASHLFGR